MRLLGRHPEYAAHPSDGDVRSRTSRVEQARSLRLFQLGVTDDEPKEHSTTSPVLRTLCIVALVVALATLGVALALFLLPSDAAR